MRGGFFFLFISIAVYLPAFAQEDIIVLMKVREGDGPFKPGRKLTIPLGDKPAIKEIPKELTEYVIRDIDCQFYNTEFKTAVGNGASKAEFIRNFKSVPEELFSDRDYNHRFLILLGKNNKSKVVVIPDLNHNLSFTDDNVFTLPVLKTVEQQKRAQKNLPSVIFPFEYYNGHQIVSLPTRVFIDPYKGSMGIRFTDSIENRHFLCFRIAEHKTGSFVFNKHEYKVLISNYSTGPEYVPSKTSLLASTGGKLITEPEGNIPYSPSDTISINGQLFEFVSVSRLGDTVRLKYAGANINNEGFAEGNNIPELSAKTVNGDRFQLSDLQGKYVLLDFWGTWCNPCIQTIPQLKTLQEKYNGKNFALVSVANDRDKAALKSFIRKHNMNWQQVYQNERGAEAETAFLKKLKITEYPTTILIDPKGKILLRNKEIEVIDRFLVQKLGM